MAESPRIPSLALSNALLFADPATDVLLELQHSTEWFDALVLATPFWAPGAGKFNKPIRPDNEEEVSALVSASIAFDPDRELRVEAFKPEKVSDSARVLLLGARHVQLQTSVTAELLPALAELIPNVTAMVVPRASQLGDSPAFLASLTRLQELSVNLGLLTSLEPLTALRKLHLGGCSHGDLSALAVLRNLESLSLSFVKNVAVYLLPLSSLSSLRELRLNNCDGEGLCDILSLDSLQSLTVGNSANLTDISALSNVKTLRELTLINCRVLQDISPLVSIPSLTTVTLRGCARIDNLSMLATSKTMQTLVSLLRERGEFSVEDSDGFIKARHHTAAGTPLSTAAPPQPPATRTVDEKERFAAEPLARMEGLSEQTKVDPWDFDEKTLPSDVPAELMDTFISFLKSDDLKENLQGTMMLRKLLEVLPRQQHIDAGFITTCVAQLLRDESPALQFQSAWSLTNIAGGDDRFTQLVSEEPGAVPNLIHLLRSPTENCREQAAWAIGNMCDTAEQRDRSLESGALEPLLENVTTADRAMPTKVKSFWAVCRLLRVKPRPPPAVVASALPVIVEMLHHEVEDFVTDGAWVLSHLSDGDCDAIQRVLNTGCVPRLIELLDGDKEKVLPAIRTIGNIVTGNDRQTQAVINGGALLAFHRLLSHTTASVPIQKEACWTLSNITGGNSDQIQSVLNANLLPAVMQAGETSPPEVRKEAVWVVANISTGGRAEQIQQLVQLEALPFFCRRLGDSSAKVAAVALEGIDNILDAGERIRVTEMRDTNPFVDVILDGGLFEHIAQLQDTGHVDTWNHLQVVLEGYFFA